MATSGVITGLMTVRNVVTMANELCSAKTINEGSPTLSDYDAQLSKRHLNWLLKSMQADGCNLFRAEDISITWPADEFEQQLDTNYLDLQEVRVRNSSDQDRPLTRWEQGEYNTLPNKLQSGIPTTYSLVKTVGNLVVRLWPVPSVETTILATGSRVIEDVVGLDETLDIPQEWTETIAYKLADRLNAAYGYSGDGDAQDVKQRADQLYSLMRDADRPGSYFMRPVR